MQVAALNQKEKKDKRDLTKNLHLFVQKNNNKIINNNLSLKSLKRYMYQSKKETNFKAHNWN